MKYVAMKIDMVHSRRLTNRREIQEELIAHTEQINTRFKVAIAAQCIVTHGDEAQCLVHLSHSGYVLDIFEYLTTSMPTVHFRCGIGLGTLSTNLQPTAIGMDGEAWLNAKRAIDLARKQRQYIQFSGFDSDLQESLNALANLLFFICSRWSYQQHEVIRLVDSGLSQSVIAERLNVSEAAVSKRLSAAGWPHYLRGRKALKALLVQIA